MAVPTGTLVQLEQKVWRIGELLGKGSFGEVYAATGPENEQAALKFVPLDRKAAREFDVWRDASGLPNVLPLWDEGEWDDQRVLAMPRAERDLRTYLRNRNGGIPVDEAKSVLLDIAAALASLSERDGEQIVHRDIKPENVLRWDGKWHIADFGIARYAERTTATDTLKAYRSWPYAARELWLDERAEPRTDIYAVGIIAHELLRRERPFTGPTVDHYKEQHLYEVPPQMDDEVIGVDLAGLIEWCLRKDVSGRPTPPDFHKRLERLVEAANPMSSPALQRANRKAVREQTEREIARQREQERIETRERRVGDAWQSLDTAVRALRNALSIDAPELVTPYKSGLLNATRGVELIDTEAVAVTVSRFSPVDDAEWQGSRPCFDVIARSGIWLGIQGTGAVERRRAYYTFWYCDAQESNVFRWFELSFKRMGRVSHDRPWEEPESVQLDRAGDAIGRRMYSHRLASPFTPIDGADVEEFVRRWVGHIGNAFEGALPSIGSFEPGEISRSRRC